MESGESEAGLGKFGIDLDGFFEMGSGLVEDRHCGDLVELRESYLRLLGVGFLAVARDFFGAFFLAVFVVRVRFAAGFACGFALPELNNLVAAGSIRRTAKR